MIFGTPRIQELVLLAVVPWITRACSPFTTPPHFLPSNTHKWDPEKANKMQGSVASHNFPTAFKFCNVQLALVSYSFPSFQYEIRGVGYMSEHWSTKLFLLNYYESNRIMIKITIFLLTFGLACWITCVIILPVLLVTCVMI